MSMILQIKNKKSFLNNFLVPISRINNSAVLTVTNKGISALLSTADGTLILYSFYESPSQIESLKLNLPDLNRLIKILNYVDVEALDFKIETNSLKYTSPGVRFTYHLLHENIIPQCPISVEKIKAVEYHTSFNIAPESLINIIKSSSFAAETTKVYFSTEEGKVHCELTDKQRANVDSVKIVVSDNFKGDILPNPLPLNFETIRIITTSRCDNGVNVLINNKKCVATFDVTNSNVKNLYISAGLTG